MINFSYVTFYPTYFLRLTYKLVYINAQQWPKVTTDMCKRNRPFTVYGSIEKTLLDNWCGFVTINWINNSFKWIMGTDRQSETVIRTAFWWQSQRAHNRWSRPNLWRSGRKVSPDQLSGKILPQEYNYEMENAAAFWTKISFLHHTLCKNL